MMSKTPLGRRTGLSPAEITRHQNDRVLAHHAEEAAFLWTQRRAATRAPHCSLHDLARLDERVDAHLEGLQLGGELAAEFCRTNLADGEGPGELFSLAVLAFSAGDRNLMLETVQAASRSAKLRSGLESALGWLEYESVSPWIAKLVNARSAAHRSRGIAAYAIHRRDPGVVLKAAIEDQDPHLRERALRAVGEVKRQDLLGDVLKHVDDEDEACRFWAAWSATLVGHHAGRGVLAAFVEQNHAFSDAALDLLLRALPLEESRHWVSFLAGDAARLRSAILGTGIVADPVCVPWLISKMELPEHARIAGEAFTFITGADIERLRLDQNPPPLTDEGDADTDADLLASDYDDNLPWPSAARVSDWWERNQRSFPPGTRHLSGAPLDKQVAGGVLVRGKQRHRAAAATELALMEPSVPLFNVRARASQQERQLTGAGSVNGTGRFSVRRPSTY